MTINVLPVYTGRVGRRRAPQLTHDSIEYYLGGKRLPPILKEEIWRDEHGEVVRYSLAYIDHLLFSGDNGRVLGYDNAHGHHHRHFMGTETRFAFTTFEKLVDRFEKEVRQLRRKSNG